MRTKESILNFLSSYFFYFLIAILGFIKVKFFLVYLGDEIYALNQLYNNLFSYLTLVEAGMGSAFIYKLYKLFAKKEYDKINQLYSGTVYIFKKIGLIMAFIAVMVSFFLPIFIKDNCFQYYYLIFTFMLFVFKNVIDYFYFVPRYVLTAQNKAYKINIIIYTFRILILVSEILLIYLKVNYIIVLIPSIIFCYIENKIINKKIFKIYPWLNLVNSRNTEIKNDMNDLIYHRLGGLIFNNIDIVLLSTFCGSTFVVIYGAYNYIIKFVIDTSNHISQAIKDGVGNILAVSDEKKNKEIINETKVIFSFIATIFCTMLFFTLNDFIRLWIGNDYSVSKVTMILFLILLFHKITNKMPQILVNTLGLFKETKIYVTITLIINLLLSLILVKKYGIDGVLLGTIIASLFIESWSYSFVSSKKIFGKFDLWYWIDYIFKSLAIIIFEIIFLRYFIDGINFLPSNIFQWFIYSFAIMMVVFVISFVLFFIFFKSFNHIIKKIATLIVRGKSRVK